MITITKPYKEDVLLPFCIRQNKNELIIEVYSEFVSVAEEFEKRFSDEPFSDEALRFIDDNIEIDGYERTDEYNDYYIMYAYNGFLDIDTEGVVSLYKAKYEVDNTGFMLDYVKEEGLPAFLIVENGEVASVCSINFPLEDGESSGELAVETVEKYRRKGYAKKVVAAMCNYLWEMYNKRSVYLSSVKNEASLALVKSIGFEEVQKEFYYNCYKRKDNAV